MTATRLGLIVVAAGSARRMEGVDKVWAPLGPHPLVWHSLATLGPLAAEIVLVVRGDHLERARDELSGRFTGLKIVAGGRERQESVARGLEALDDPQVIAVHDAARPFPTRQLLTEGARLLDSYDGAVPAQPVSSTVKRVDSDGVIAATVDREQLRLAQTPQVFRSHVLRRAHAAAGTATRRATDDSDLAERLGYRITTFPGSERNVKVTTPVDLALARLLLQDVHAQ